VISARFPTELERITIADLLHARRNVGATEQAAGAKPADHEQERQLSLP
jgi:hypothetical protein